MNVSNTFLLDLSVLLALCGPSPPSSRTMGLGAEGLGAATHDGTGCSLGLLSAVDSNESSPEPFLNGGGAVGRAATSSRW